MLRKLASRLPRWREVSETFYQLICKAFYGGADLLSKGGAHKYIRRVPTGKTSKTGRPIYRYHYRVTGGHGLAHDDEIHEGSAFQIVHNGQKGHFHVEKVNGDKVTVRHDESGHTQEMTKQELREALHSHHEDDIKAAKDAAQRDYAKAQVHGTQKQQKRAREHLHRTHTSLHTGSAADARALREAEAKHKRTDAAYAAAERVEIKPGDLPPPKTDENSRRSPRFESWSAFIELTQSLIDEPFRVIRDPRLKANQKEKRAGDAARRMSMALEALQETLKREDPRAGEIRASLEDLREAANAIRREGSFNRKTATGRAAHSLGLAAQTTRGRLEEVLAHPVFEAARAAASEHSAAGMEVERAKWRHGMSSGEQAAKRAASAAESSAESEATSESLRLAEERKNKKLDEIIDKVEGSPKAKRGTFEISVQVRDEKGSPTGEVKKEKVKGDVLGAFGADARTGRVIDLRTGQSLYGANSAGGRQIALARYNQVFPGGVPMERQADGSMAPSAAASEAYKRIQEEWLSGAWDEASERQKDRKTAQAGAEAREALAEHESKPAPDVKHSVSPEKLKPGELHREALSYTSKDPSRPNLGHVLVDDGHAVATDGHRMLIAPVEEGTKPGMWGYHDTEEGEQARKKRKPLSHGSSDLRYPDYKQVLPRNAPTREATLSQESLKRVKAAAKYLSKLKTKDGGRAHSSSDPASVRLHSEGGRLVMTVDHSAHEGEPIKLDLGPAGGGSNFDTHVNIKYLADAIGNAKSVRMTTTAPEGEIAPLMFERSDGAKVMVMPVRK